MKKIAAILFFIFTFRVTAGENNFIYMGAGGEDSGKEDTIFDDGAKEMVKAFSQMRSSYKATIAFNGGHSKTEGIINKGFAGNDIRNGFSSTNYNGIIQDLIAKINQKPNGQIQPYGQILKHYNSYPIYHGILVSTDLCYK